MTKQRLVITRLSNPIVGEVRGLVGDFISSGLADEISWLDVSNPSRIILQSTSGETTLDLSDWMADHLASILDLELVVFQTLVDGFVEITQEDLRQALSFDETLSKQMLSGSSILVPGADATNYSDNIFLTNRVNLIVSPVDGRAPLSPAVKVEGDGDRYFGHAATSLISLLGLWRGQNDYPPSTYRESARGITKPIFIVRTYIRHIDASGLVGSVIEEALTVKPGSYSTFDNQGVPFTKVQPHAQQGVIREVAKEFIALNKAMLTLAPAVPYRPKERSARTFSELIKEYLSFMGSIVQSPGTWAQTKFNEIRGDIARKTQNAFLGKDSEYEVFVNGVSGIDSDLELDAVSQLVSAADSIRGNVQRPPAPNPGNLWSDLSNVSSSLVDAAEVNADLQMPGVSGGARDVVSNPAYLVRSGDVDIFLISPNLPIPLAGKVLKPSDPYLYVLAKSQIEEALANNKKLTGSQQNLLEEAKVGLEGWSNQQSSLLWAVGEQIAYGLNAARKALLPQKFESDDELDQKTLVDLELNVRRKFLRIILGALGITALGGLAWLAQAVYLNIISGRWPTAFSEAWALIVLVFLAVLLLWMLVTTLIFDRGMRELFALRHRRLEAKRRLEHNQLQAAHNLQEILRLGEIYAQFQAWSMLLTPPILEPIHLGDTNSNALGKIRISDLPSSFTQGKLTADSDEVSNLADRVKSQFFSVGWLNRTINGYLESLGADLGRVWQESPSDARSTLNRALSKATAGTDVDQWKKSSSTLARQIAIQSANYQSWPLAADFGKGKIIDSSQEFMQELANGSEPLPGTLLTDATTVGQGNRLDRDLSKIYLDSRLSLSSELRTHQFDPFVGLTGRELDLMAVRIDVSQCMTPINLKFVQNSQEPNTVGELSKDSISEPEA